MPRVQGGLEVGQVEEGRGKMKPLGCACLASLRVVDGHILLRGPWSTSKSYSTIPRFRPST
jgi:hypothetical protein